MRPSKRLMGAGVMSLLLLIPLIFFFSLMFLHSNISIDPTDASSSVGHPDRLSQAASHASSLDSPPSATLTETAPRQPLPAAGAGAGLRGSSVQADSGRKMVGPAEPPVPLVAPVAPTEIRSPPVPPPLPPAKAPVVQVQRKDKVTVPKSAEPLSSILDRAYLDSKSPASSFGGSTPRSLDVLLDELIVDRHNEPPLIVDPSHPSSPDHPYKDIYAKVKRRLVDDSVNDHDNFTFFVHYSSDSSLFASIVAAKHPSSLVLSMCSSDSLCRSNSTAHTSGNVLVGTLPLTDANLPSVFPPPSSSSTASPAPLTRPFSTYQLFPDIAELCAPLLPHECERSLANLVLQSCKSFFPARRPSLTYFDYWANEKKDGWAALLHAVGRLLKDTHGVTMTVLSGGGGVGSSSAESPSWLVAGGIGSSSAASTSEIITVTWHVGGNPPSTSAPSVCPKPGGKTTPSRGFGFDLQTLLSMGLSDAGSLSVFQAVIRAPPPPLQSSKSPLQISPPLYGHGTISYPDDAKPLSDAEVERLSFEPANRTPLAEEEKEAVDDWRRVLKPDDAFAKAGKDAPTAMLLSGRGAALLATKLATEAKVEGSTSSTFVSVSFGGGARNAQHRRLNSHLQVSSVYVCDGELSSNTVQGVLAPHLDSSSPRRAPFDYHVASSDTYAAALHEALFETLAVGAKSSCTQRLVAFERSLGRMLKLSGKVALLQVPAAPIAATALRLLASGWISGGVSRFEDCTSAFEDRYAAVGGIDEAGALKIIKAALGTVGDGVDATVESVHEREGRYLIRVDFEPETKVDGGGKNIDEYLGISLHSLQWLGVDRKIDLKRLARKFLKKDVDEEALGGKDGALPPWKVWIVGDEVVIGDRARDPATLVKFDSESARRTWSLMNGEISKDISSESELRAGLVSRGLALDAMFDRTAFSLLDVGSGAVGSLAAARYENAVVVSIAKEGPSSAALTASIVASSRWNHAVATKESVSAISKNLYESPELMRYSVLDGLDVLDETASSRSFSRVVGGIFNSSLTTFVVLPSAKAVSLADTLLGPRSAPVKFSWSGSAAKTFKLAGHPASELKNFEIDFLSLSAGARPDVAVSHVSMSMVLDAPSSLSLSSSSALVRVDIVNATRKVHHHYDYGKDGHKRTYTMHVAARGPDEKMRTIGVGVGGVKDDERGKFPIMNNGKWTDVTLVRDSDKHLIPYKEIKSLTLIAVLRMGLSSPLKKHAYEQFLKLPLYEDMAPWNIVMQGSAMEYIDYDTRDVTFDSHVRHAYQVLSVLMNYKRTVEDFNKCGGKASTPYGFGLVSDCVGSSFKGPCDEPERPVPCNTAKGSCQTDFISCLKAIAEEDEDA